MNRIFARASLACALCLATILVASPPAALAAGPETLADSTVTESWRLPNGLEVVTRHVPKTTGVAITVLYRGGRDDDPPGREGLASLLAEVAFTAAAGDVPERTRDELASLRPLGWTLDVEPTHTVFSELAMLPQFPGVLHQVAQRMRGVQVTDAVLRRASARVKSDLARAYSENGEMVAYHQIRLLATGHGPEFAQRYASGKGLQGMSSKDVQARIRTLHVPANAVLSLAGNLSAFDVHRMIENEFGTIPTGTRAPDRPRPPLTPGIWQIEHGGLAGPISALGVIAPALSDSAHPYFFMHTLILGSVVKKQWGPTYPPLSSRFEYSLLDDPDLVRFYPEGAVGPDSNVVGFQLWRILGQLPAGTVDTDTHERLEQGVAWLLGGPLPAGLLRQMVNEPATLNVLAGGMAVRRMRGDEAFWAQYRQRFHQSKDSPLGDWLNRFAVEHCVQLRLEPAH